MNEYAEMFEKFSKLGVNEKRDALSEEIIKISYILKEYLNKYNQEIIEEPFNYSKVDNSNLSESEMLNLEYKDLYYIKQELILLLSLINK